MDDTLIGPNYIFKIGQGKDVGYIITIHDALEKELLEQGGVTTFNKVNFHVAHRPGYEKKLVYYKTYRNVNKLMLECKKYPERYNCNHSYCKIGGITPPFQWTKCLPHICRNCKLVDKNNRVVIDKISSYSIHNLPFSTLF